MRRRDGKDKKSERRGVEGLKEAYCNLTEVAE